MKKHLYIAYFAYLAIVSSLVCLLCACSGGTSDEPTPVVPVQPVDPTQPQQKERPMGFFASASAFSRAGSPLEDQHKLFKVWAYKTLISDPTANQLVMPGYQVKYFDMGWHYDGTSNPSHTELDGQFLKYWDGSASSYDFYAYAPLTLPSNITLTEDPETGFSFKDVPTHISSFEPVDIVVAKQTRHIYDNEGLKDLDALVEKENEHQPSVYYEPVPLVFHHILSKVEYRIYNSGTKDKVSINNITIELDRNKSFYTGGTYNNDQWEDFTDPSSELLKLRFNSPLEITPAKDKTESTWLATYYEIPQSLDKRVTITIEIDGTPGTFNFDSSERWQLDKVYIYYIVLKVDDGNINPIYVTLEEEDFVYGDDITPDPVTNW